MFGKETSPYSNSWVSFDSPAELKHLSGVRAASPFPIHAFDFTASLYLVGAPPFIESGGRGFDFRGRQPAAKALDRSWRV